MKTARHFNSSCPDCNRWRCICNAMQCPDCGEWGEGACACIRREDGFPPYPPAREVQAGAPRSAPAWGRPAARTAPPDSDTRARLAKLRAEIAAHLGPRGCW